MNYAIECDNIDYDDIMINLIIRVPIIQVHVAVNHLLVINVALKDQYHLH